MYISTSNQRNTSKLDLGKNESRIHAEATKVPFDIVSPKLRLKQETTMGDVLSTLGTMMLSGTGIAILCSPLIYKNPSKWSNLFINGINVFRKAKLTTQQEVSILNRLSDRETVNSVLQKSIMGILFIAGINTYQTALNSKQPSLMLSTLIRDISSAIGIFFPNPYIFLAYAFGGIFYGAAKQNDIANNNHPRFRREWDLHRLKKSFQTPESPLNQTAFVQDVKSLVNFIEKDIELTFKFSHWKKLSSDITHPASWQEPKSYLTALSTQVVTLSTLLSLVGIQSSSVLLRKAGGIGSFISESLASLAFIARAFLHRHELDGQLVLLGSPLASIGTIFLPQNFPNLFFLSGLTISGGAIGNKGLNINSKRFAAFRDELQWLAIQSQKHPEIKAQAILQKVRTDLNDASILKKRFGESRLNEIKKLLEQAIIAEQNGVNLRDFLAPTLLSSNVTA